MYNLSSDYDDGSGISLHKKSVKCDLSMLVISDSNTKAKRVCEWLMSLIVDYFSGQIPKDKN